MDSVHRFNLFHMLRKMRVIAALFPVVLFIGSLLPVQAKGAVSRPEPTPSLPPVIIGHQGVAGLAPGNTMAGFALAIDLGVDAIELDVVLSADENIIVYHDFRLHPERTRNGQGRWLSDAERIPIKNLTLGQLKTYDVGRLKPGTASARKLPDQKAVDGQKIPTLEEVLELLRQTGSDGPDLHIEIKSSPNEVDVSPSPQVMADKVLRLLDEYELTSRCKIYSFDWRALSRVNEIAPSIATVYLTSQYKQLKMFDKKNTLLWTGGIDPDDFDRSLPEMVKAAGGKYWGAKYGEIWQSHVQQAHEAGLKVYAWTVDSESDMRHLVDTGIDGIITNRPDKLKEVIANVK